MNTTESVKPRWWREGILRRLLEAGLLLSIAFGVVHLLGYRTYTSVLCGSIPETAQNPEQAALFGALYAAFYFAFVVGTPICLIAIPIYLILKRCFLRRV